VTGLAVRPPFREQCNVTSELALAFNTSTLIGVSGSTPRKVITGDAWRDMSRSLPPPTDDDVSITKDGRRLDSKEKVLEFLAELELEREAERAGSAAGE